MYKTSKILTTKRESKPKIVLQAKAEYKEHRRSLMSLKNKVISSIRFELKFAEGGVFYFDTPLLDMNKRPIKCVSSKYVFYDAWTELILEKLSIETLLDILETLE